MGQALFSGKRQPPGWIAAAALLVVLALGYVDYVTGPLVAISIFYLVPVCVVTWLAGQRVGSLLAGAGAAVWVAADLALTPAVPVAVLCWNAAARLGVFLFVVQLLAA